MCAIHVKSITTEYATRILPPYFLNKLVALARILWLHQFYTLVMFLSVLMNSWRFSQIIENLQNHEKYRNSLTLLKEINNNISILFKRSYLLKYSSYYILSMRKRISLILYIFPLFLNLFGCKIWKYRNFEDCLKIFKNNWNLKISTNKKWKNLKISKFLEINLKKKLKIWKISRCLVCHWENWGEIYGICLLSTCLVYLPLSSLHNTQWCLFDFWKCNSSNIWQLECLL